EWPHSHRGVGCLCSQVRDGNICFLVQHDRIAISPIPVFIQRITFASIYRENKQRGSTAIHAVFANYTILVIFTFQVIISRLFFLLDR
ncbi:MAG: hypothetical protein K8R16_01045, partial [Anaerolineales bacterium]|nr:hypothetical protein [Anaerolineales bacterium]